VLPAAVEEGSVADAVRDPTNLDSTQC